MRCHGRLRRLHLVFEFCWESLQVTTWCVLRECVTAIVDAPAAKDQCRQVWQAHESCRQLLHCRALRNLETAQCCRPAEAGQQPGCCFV